MTSGRRARARWSLIALALCPALAEATDYHLEVTGRDLPDSGTTVASAWRTFPFALPRLSPGDTLWVGDGTWSRADGGLPDLDCDAGIGSHGTAGAPVTVRAVNPRKAHLFSDGVSDGAHVYRCSHWVLDGLRVSVVDAPSSLIGGGITVGYSTDVTVKNVLVQGNNRAANSHGIEVNQSSRVLVEDNEVYDFTRAGVLLWDSNGCIARRNYLGSRNRADGTYVSSYPSRGDDGIETLGLDSLSENNISEGNGAGFLAYSYGGGSGHRFLGNISLDDGVGAVVSKNSGAPIEGTVFLDQLVVRPIDQGTYFRSAHETQCVRCSVLESGGSAYLADRLPADTFTLSARFHSSIATGRDAGFGVSVMDQDALEVSDVRVSGFPTLANPGGAGFDVSPGNVGRGGCFLASPDGGVSGRDGGPLGATVLYRTVDGVLTTAPLWDPVTGRFTGCGALVPGVNDDPNTSCIGVHQRLAAGTAQCPFPSGYGGADAGAPDAGNPDAGGGNDGGGGTGGGGGGGTGGGTGDGGTPVAVRLGVGCGCGQAPGALGVLALLLGLSGRRRRASLEPH